MDFRRRKPKPAPENVIGVKPAGFMLAHDEQGVWHVVTKLTDSDGNELKLAFIPSEAATMVSGILYTMMADLGDELSLQLLDYIEGWMLSQKKGDGCEPPAGGTVEEEKKGNA